MSLKNTTSEVLPILDYKYQVVLDKEYGKVFILAEQQIMICEIAKEYVPIEDFKEIFLETIPFIEKYSIKKFIFDKQNLRIFHQPSMEWYFVHWKKEVYQLGLKIHRKILPQDELSFSIAVEAGRSKIMEDYKDTIIPLIDIQNKTSVLEAIES